MLFRVILKVKGDVLADVEIPLIEGELRGLGVGEARVLSLEQAWQLLPSHSISRNLLARKMYSGLSPFYCGTASWEILRGLRERSTYISDIFAWPLATGIALHPKQVATRLGIPFDGNDPDRGASFRIYRDGNTLHVVPIYWFIEYSFHAVKGCASPRQVQSACEHLFRLPFGDERSPLAGKVFGKNSYTTAHFTHGLHQYKGKFFPRMVRSLLNAKQPSLVVDPFCGSGTLQAEASLSGYVSIGFDLNPLSVELCKMKNEVVEADAKDFEDLRLQIEDEVGSPRQLRLLREPRAAYGAVATFRASFPEDLRQRLPREDVDFIGNLMNLVQNRCHEPYRHIFRMVVSDCIKSKVKVRVGGKTQFFYSIEPNSLDLRELFLRKVLSLSCFLSGWSYLRDRLGIRLEKTTVLRGDARCWPPDIGAPDMVITSPPYFPYTGISYVFTNLAAMAVLGVGDLREIERSMMGNTLDRRFSGEFLFDDIDDIRDLFAFLQSDRYRADRIPVYKRYFMDLYESLAETARRCTRGAEIRFVIAKFQKLYKMREKKTVHCLDCGRIVSEIARRAGLEIEGYLDIPLFKSDKVSLFPSNEGIETVLSFRPVGGQ